MAFCQTAEGIDETERVERRADLAPWQTRLMIQEL